MAELPSERTRVIVGLGNPGTDYVATRHNVGFRVVELLAERQRVDMGDLRACRARGAKVGDRLWVMPQTYMNRSGFTVRCLVERYNLEPEQVLIVYDEVHLALGRLRLRPKGSPAGHRGLESVLEALGTDLVPRLRLGVGGEDGPPAGEDLVDFVLAPFADAEHTEVDAMVARAADACEMWAAQGIEAAMQSYNG
ncbi:MAG: aminoacyl-tRNA hydrolase [Acidobacteriota bacterium]